MRVRMCIRDVFDDTIMTPVDVFDRHVAYFHLSLFITVSRMVLPNILVLTLLNRLLSCCLLSVSVFVCF